MVYCRACRFFKFGTLGPGWCKKKDKLANPKDEACAQRIGKYRKPALKITKTVLGGFLI